MSSLVEVKTKPQQLFQQEIFYPHTSFEFGEHIAKSTNLESIASADSNVTGSDKWINMVMNPTIEKNAITAARQNFDNLNLHISIEEKDKKFDLLLNRWLLIQLQFCLAENGCGKHLQVQPNYYFNIKEDLQGIYLTPTDVTQFGDLSHKYVEVNPRVGTGLINTYKQYLRGTDQWTVIVSPSEEYESYGSGWDVINVMRQINSQDNESIAEGKYLICKRKLSIVERRFLHNLFFQVGQNTTNISKLLELSRSELIQEIETQKLQTATQLNHEIISEHEQLVQYPNSFTNKDNLDLFSLAIDINTIFKKRFGESIFDEQDITMYPTIEELAKEYLLSLKQLLLSNDEKEYRRVLRQMIYHCQTLWKMTTENQAAHPINSHNQESTDDSAWDISQFNLVSTYLDSLMNGEFTAGFEFMSDSSNPWDYGNNLSSLTWQPSTLAYNQPFGWESVNYCRIHGYYEGAFCQKCYKKSTEDQSKD